MPQRAQRARLRSFIQDSFLVDRFSDEDSFLGTGLIDSLGMMQLVAFVEGEWAIHVEDAELVPENFDSVARVAAFVERKRSVQAA
jgi:acyl carrier protein